jgi:hypothetical protein
MSLVINPNAKAATRTTLAALVESYIASGNTVVVCPTRNQKPRTFGRKGAIAHRGRKIENLRACGYAKANG